MMKKNLKIGPVLKGYLLLLFVILLLVGCGKIIDSEEEPPQLNDAVTDLSVVMNDSIELYLEYIDAHDINGDAMSLRVLDGEYYTINGNMVIPETNFVGDIIVGYQVLDAGGLASEIGTIIVSVIPDIYEVAPLYIGANWEYRDIFYKDGLDSLDSSSLRITATYAPTVTGYSEEIFIAEWLNLEINDGHKLQYIYTNTDVGLVQIGGISATDTLISPELKLKNPVITGDSWDYSLLRYNKNLGKFFKDTTIEKTTCTDEKVYITVPAGTFQCIEYTYTYYFDSTNTWGSRAFEYENFPVVGDGVLIPGVSKTRAVGDPYITVKLCYAPGVGFVKNLTYRDGVLIQEKMLTKYTVNESI